MSTILSTWISGSPWFKWFLVTRKFLPYIYDIVSIAGYLSIYPNDSVVLRIQLTAEATGKFPLCTRYGETRISFPIQSNRSIVNEWSL